MNEQTDPFDGRAAVKGLEMLGRGITDAHGAISGSPANWELTRGAGGEEPPTAAAAPATPTESEEAAVLADLSAIMGRAL